MAVNNSLIQAQQQTPARFNAFSADYAVNGNMIHIEGNDVVRFFVSGHPELATETDVAVFIQTCKSMGLNPFLKDAYLIKYNSEPGQIIVSKGALEKRAFNNPRFRGFQAGIIIRRADGKLDKRMGTFYIKDEETLLGGWAKVFVDGYSEPVESAVSLAEYSTGKSVWSSKPATMIRKVAKCQAIREAFPDEIAMVYEEEEIAEAQECKNEEAPPMQYHEPVHHQEPAQYAEPPMQYQTPPPVMDAEPAQADDFTNILMGG